MLKKLFISIVTILVFYIQAARSSMEGETSNEVLSSKLQEIQGYLDAERSSRTDLEMFVAVLNTQKGAQISV